MEIEIEMRKSRIERKTKETDVKLELNIDGTGNCSIETGLGFFNHMLTAFSVHSGFDIELSCKGDLEVDCHHTIEDIGIVLGQAFSEALGSKDGIARYGNFSIPMDEALATCTLDISGRPYLVFNAEFFGEKIGDMDTQMVEEFFRAFAMNAKICLHINLLYGKNDHHICEAIFKGVAHGLKSGVSKGAGEGVLSSKGVL